MNYNERYPFNNISPLAWIHPDVKIGRGNTIGPFCMIGGPAEWKGHETEGKVIIGNANRITGHVTIDSGTAEYTMLGDECYLMKHCHVGHDCLIYSLVTISCGAKIGGHTSIGRMANIGLNAVIHQGHHIGEGAMIGMGAVITKGLVVEKYCVYVGNPAKFIKPNVNHPNYPAQKSL